MNVTLYYHLQQIFLPTSILAQHICCYVVKEIQYTGKPPNNCSAKHKKIYCVILRFSKLENANRCQCSFTVTFKYSTASSLNPNRFGKPTTTRVNRGLDSDSSQMKWRSESWPENGPRESCERHVRERGTDTYIYRPQETTGHRPGESVCKVMRNVAFVMFRRRICGHSGTRG